MNQDYQLNQTLEILKDLCQRMLTLLQEGPGMRGSSSFEPWSYASSDPTNVWLSIIKERCIELSAHINTSVLGYEEESSRRKIQAMGHSNPIVATCLNLHTMGRVTWEEAMNQCVLGLGQQLENLLKAHIKFVSKQIVPMIIELEKDSKSDMKNQSEPCAQPSEDR